MVSGLRGYLLTGEKSFVESYESANTENESILGELSSLVADSVQTNLLNQIKQLNDHWTEEYTEPLRQAKLLSNISDSNLRAFNKIYREKFATGDEKEIQNRLQSKFRAFTNLEYDLRNVKKESLATSVRSTRRISIVLTIISIVTALVVVSFLIRKISGRIAKMTGMANTISAGNYDVHLADTGNDELSSLGNSLNHMAAEMSRSISLLMHSNAELEQFAHVVSHDMKGPLRGISNVITWIEEDHGQELTPKVSEYVELIKGRITRAENLIAGLLAYARADKDALEIEAVDVNVLVEEVLENLPDRGDTEIRISPMPTVHAERLLLFQVFSNLISNAFKHNNKAQGEVKIYCKKHPAYFEFFIEHNGIGIDEKHHERIFRIFQTLTDRDSFESAGVGLAIVKKILDSKNQTITVTSKPGEGSIFSFTWPKK
jgi:signal transduction histidine kinase